MQSLAHRLLENHAKWGVGQVTHPNRRGMFDGKTLAELRSARDKLKRQMKKAAGNVSHAMKIKLSQLTFAIRAEQKGKGKFGRWGHVGSNLYVLSDDIKQSLVLQGALQKLGMTAHIVEPEENPDFIGKDIEKIRQSGKLYEIVKATKANLGITASITQDGKIHASLATYSRPFTNDTKHQPDLLFQITSRQPVTIVALARLAKQLIALADNRHKLQREMTELNHELHWIASRRVRSHKPGKVIAATEESSRRVMDTILAQLGGNKFMAMTGAKNLVRLQTGLQMDLPGKLTKDRINRVTIILTGADEYVITAYRLRNLDLHKLKVKTGIHAAQLAETFTAITGLDTRL